MHTEVKSSEFSLIKLYIYCQFGYMPLSITDQRKLHPLMCHYLLSDLRRVCATWASFKCKFFLQFQSIYLLLDFFISFITLSQKSTWNTLWLKAHIKVSVKHITVFTSSWLYVTMVFTLHTNRHRGYWCSVGWYFLLFAFCSTIELNVLGRLCDH